MWLLHISVKKRTAATLNSTISMNQKSSCKRKNEGTLTASCEVVTYRFLTYTTDDVISKTNDRMMRFPPSSNTLVKYAELFWAQVYRRFLVYK